MQGFQWGHLYALTGDRNLLSNITELAPSGTTRVCSTRVFSTDEPTTCCAQNWLVSRFIDMSVEEFNNKYPNGSVISRIVGPETVNSNTTQSTVRALDALVFKRLVL